MTLLWAAFLVSASWQAFTHQGAVNDLLLDGSTLYAATGGGISVFSTADSTFIGELTTVDGLPGNRCRCLVRDPAGNLWIGTTGGGLAVYDPRTGVVISYLRARPEALFETEVSALAIAPPVIAVGTPNGLYLVDTRASYADPADDVITRVSDVLVSNLILAVAARARAETTEVWVGSDLGLSQLRALGSSVELVAHYDHISGLPGDSTSALLLGDTVFAATNRGLAQVVGDSCTTFYLFDTAYSVHRLGRDRGAFLLATSLGFYRYDLTRWTKLFPYSPVPPWVCDVHDFVVAGTTWLGLSSTLGDARGYGIYTLGPPLRNFIAPGPAYAIAFDACIDTAGSLWACHGMPPNRLGISRRRPDGSWQYYTDRGALCAANCAADRAGGVWVGHWVYDSGGVSYFRGTDSTRLRFKWGDFTTLNVISAVAVDAADRCWAWQVLNNSLAVLDTTGELVRLTPHNPSRVYGMTVDAAGRAWLAAEGGLICYDPRGTLLDPSDDVDTLFTAADGLPSNHLHQTAVDAAGRVWLASDRGAAMYDGRRFTVFTNASTGQKLLSDEVVSVRVDGWGDVWFLTSGGISIYRPYAGRWAEPIRPGAGGLLPGLEFMSLCLDEARSRVVVGTGGGIALGDFRHEPPDTTLAGALAFPNPFVPAQGHERITIRGLPPGSTVRIYTLDGMRVATLPPVDVRTDAVFWEPARAASGVYLAVIAWGRERRVVKLAVVR